VSRDVHYALVLRGGRVPPEGARLTPGGPPVPCDLAIGFDGRIARISPSVGAAGVEEWHLDGRLILPGLVDLHQHLDKTRTVRLTANPAGTLSGAVEGFRAYALRTTHQDILMRARQTVDACLMRGTVAIRTHANVDRDWGLRAVEALAELREAVRDRIRIEVVAFLTSSGLHAPPSEALRLVESALDAGADVVGGAPALAADPLATIDMLFDLASRRGRRLDLHIDESLDPAERHLAYVALRAREYGMAERVVVGHCCSLSAMMPEMAMPIVRAVAEAGVGVVTMPASNLFLQGRDAPRLPPRGLTRVRDLLAAGVRVACAWDNIQDPFNPVGTGDLLEVSRWTFLAAHLPWEMSSHLYAMVSTVPAGLMGLEPDFGVREGAFADLMIVDAADPLDAVLSGPLERTVLFHGRHVSGPTWRSSTAAEGTSQR
jgi:cytosine deaminase